MNAGAKARKPGDAQIRLDVVSAAHASFASQGWMVFDLPDPRPVHEGRKIVLDHLRRTLGKPDVTLEGYHAFAGTDARHTEVQLEMTRWFREHRLGPDLIRAQRSFFQALLGPDLDVQRNPYLRITRPGCPQDTTGIHADTFYGGSPYELSVIVPYVDVPAPAALGVLTGSFDWPLDRFEVRQEVSPDVTKGSPRHQLGFPYAPKVPGEAPISKMVPVPLKVGQALVFNLAILHGSTGNLADVTRWSFDCRVKHALAPVDLSARPDYYEPWCRSAVTEQAEAFHRANPGFITR